MEQNATNGFPTPEPGHVNGTFEPQGVIQNGSSQHVHEEPEGVNGTSESQDVLQNGSSQHVHEEPEEALLDTALTTTPAVLPKTCGCASPTTEHLNHLDNIDAFPEKLLKALKSMSPSQRQYDRVCVVSVCWQTSDTPELTKDAKYLQDVLEIRYGYEVHRYLLNNAGDKIQKIALDLMFQLMNVGRDVDKQDMHNLFILHYAGHGGRSKDGDETKYLWQPDSKTEAGSALKWTDFESIVEKFDCDVLLLLDCCFAGGMLSNEKNWLRRVELIGAAGPDDSAVFNHRVKPTKKDKTKPYTLTSAFAKELERRKNDNGTDVSYIVNYMQGKDASTRYHLAPSPTYQRNNLHRDSEVPLNSSIFLQSKLQLDPTTSSGAKTREDYIREISCLNDLRVVITLRIANSAERLVVEDYKRWFYYRPQNIDLDGVDVEIECYSLAESNSSLAVFSIPWWLWNLLPPDPAYERIGVVRSKNFAPINTPRLEPHPQSLENKTPEMPHKNVTFYRSSIKGKDRQIDHRPKPKTMLAIENSSTQPPADFRRPAAPKSHKLKENSQNSWHLPRHQATSHVRQPVDVQTKIQSRLQGQSWDDVSRRLSRFDRTDQSMSSLIAKVGRPFVALKSK